MTNRTSKTPCEFCGGTGRVAHVVLSDQGEKVTLLKKPLPVLGYVVDRACPQCVNLGRIASSRNEEEERNSTNKTDPRLRSSQMGRN